MLVESFDPGFLEEMGLGYDELSSGNPGLVQISVSDFGQWGPYAGYKANELIEHAISGLMYPTGFPDQEPVPSGGLLPQFKSGMSGVIAALSALHWREVSGEGQQVGRVDAGGGSEFPGDNARPVHVPGGGEGQDGEQSIATDAPVRTCTRRRTAT